MSKVERFRKPNPVWIEGVSEWLSQGVWVYPDAPEYKTAKYIAGNLADTINYILEGTSHDVTPPEALDELRKSVSSVFRLVHGPESKTHLGRNGILAAVEAINGNVDATRAYIMWSNSASEIQCSDILATAYLVKAYKYFVRDEVDKDLLDVAIAFMANHIAQRITSKRIVKS